jgi:hypothetical protein
MLMDKAQEREALKALLKALSQGEEEEEEEEEKVGDYVEGRRESSVTPEEVEGELYDKEEEEGEEEEKKEEDEEEVEGGEENLDELEPPKEMSLKDLVASFMEGEEDPFASKKGLRGGGGSLEIEVKKEGVVPAKALAKKALGMKKAKKKARGM